MRMYRCVAYKVRTFTLTTPSILRLEITHNALLVAQDTDRFRAVVWLSILILMAIHSPYWATTSTIVSLFLDANPMTRIMKTRWQLPIFITITRPFTGLFMMTLTRHHCSALLIYNVYKINSRLFKTNEPLPWLKAHQIGRASCRERG